MASVLEDRQELGPRALTLQRRHGVAWIVILIVDASFILWGGMAALLLEHLPGPHSLPILNAGYEGFTRGSWKELTAASPLTASYITVLFRLYGAYCLVFGVMSSAIAVTAFRRGERWAWWTLLVGNTIALPAAMRYDWIANAIGPFELTEYIGLALVFGALVVTAPFGAARRQSRH
jgi:hypothetical protein